MSFLGFFTVAHADGGCEMETRVVMGEALAHIQISRNSFGNLTPRRKTRFRKFPWKFDPLGRKSRPFLLDFPLRTPQNLEMPLLASENLRFQVQTSQNH